MNRIGEKIHSPPFAFPDSGRAARSQQGTVGRLAKDREDGPNPAKPIHHSTAFSARWVCAAGVATSTKCLVAAVVRRLVVRPSATWTLRCQLVRRRRHSVTLSTSYLVRARQVVASSLAMPSGQGAIIGGRSDDQERPLGRHS
jgi:hypothetical protein